MSRRFQFSVRRLLVSMSLLCLSLSLLSWAMAGDAPVLFIYFATIALGVCGTNLVGRPLLGAVVMMLLWTGVLLIRAASNASW